MDNDSRKNIAILAFTFIVVMLGYGLVIPRIPGRSGRDHAGSECNHVLRDCGK